MQISDTTMFWLRDAARQNPNEGTIAVRFSPEQWRAIVSKLDAEKATPDAAPKHGDDAGDGLRYVLCKVGFGEHYKDWLLIPHADGQYVTAAKLEPFSIGVLRHALAAAPPAPAEPAQVSSDNATEAMVSVPREYTDEMLARAVAAIDEHRRAVGDCASAESLAGIAYDMMIACAAPAPTWPVVAPALPAVTDADVVLAVRTMFPTGTEELSTRNVRAALESFRARLGGAK